MLNNPVSDIGFRCSLSWFALHMHSNEFNVNSKPIRLKRNIYIIWENKTNFFEIKNFDGRIEKARDDTVILLFSRDGRIRKLRTRHTGQTTLVSGTALWWRCRAEHCDPRVPSARSAVPAPDGGSICRQYKCLRFHGQFSTVILNNNGRKR